MDKRSRFGWTPLLLVGGAWVAYKTLVEKPTDAADGNELTFLDTFVSGVSTTLSTLAGTKESNFIEKMTPIALQIQQTYGIAPLITLTQSALESGWGLSGLTAKANNLFGFTGDSWASSGKSVITMKTHEVSPYAPDKIQYFSSPGDIVSKTARADGGSDLMVNRPFRAYPTWYDSVSDWAQLLKGARYTAALKAAQAGDLEKFALEVAAAGYATEPDYAQQLVEVGDRIEDIQTA